MKMSMNLTTTRVLFYLKSLQLYLLTNMEGEVNQRFPVFLINKSGTKSRGAVCLVPFTPILHTCLWTRNLKNAHTES